MIRDKLRRVTGRALRGAVGMEHLPSSPTGRSLPLDMFDVQRTAAEASAARRLERLYHRGQERIWDGKEVLSMLVERHGGVHLDPAQAAAVRRIFAVILWGELAAWKISANLALHLVPLEAKMAATSQAHDEARHFYVMHDYLQLTGEVPTDPGPAAQRVLGGVLAANTLAKQLMGMQMMIEPMALTLFQTVRELGFEPVLADLMAYYERDEARHVALGVLHLPALLEHMTYRQAADLYSWQVRMYLAEFDLLHELAPAFEALGVSPRDVLEVGQKKQLVAAQMLLDELGHDLPIVEVFRRLTDFKAELEFPPPGASTRFDRRLRRAVERAWKASGRFDGELTDVATAA